MKPFRIFKLHSSQIKLFAATYPYWVYDNLIWMVNKQNSDVYLYIRKEERGTTWSTDRYHEDIPLEEFKLFQLYYEAI